MSLPVAADALAFGDLVSRVSEDDDTFALAEEAFRSVAPMLVADGLLDFLDESTLKLGDHYKWELAAAYLLQRGRSTLGVQDSHPLSAQEISDRHGFRSALEGLEHLDPETGILDVEGRRYEEHAEWPAWRELDSLTCPDHGLPLQDVLDMETQAVSQGCPRCCIEGASS